MKQTPNSIGYVELVYALQNQDELRHGEERGRRVGRRPDLESITAAAAGAAKNMPADFRVSITNAPGKTAYPDLDASPGCWFRRKIPDAAKGRPSRRFLKWMLTDGQKYCAALGLRPAARRRW